MRQGSLGGAVSLIREADAAGKSGQVLGTRSFSQFWIKGCKWLSMSCLKKGSVPETFSSQIGHSNKAQSLSFQISLYTRTLEGWKVLSSLLQRCWNRKAGTDWTEIQMWWWPREKSRFLSCYVKTKTSRREDCNESHFWRCAPGT